MLHFGKWVSVLNFLEKSKHYYFIHSFIYIFCICLYILTRFHIKRRMSFILNQNLIISCFFFKSIRLINEWYLISVGIIILCILVMYGTTAEAYVRKSHNLYGKFWVKKQMEHNERINKKNCVRWVKIFVQNWISGSFKFRRNIWNLMIVANYFNILSSSTQKTFSNNITYLIHTLHFCSSLPEFRYRQSCFSAQVFKKQEN